jgi:diaminohydroxyphosphoribosylaminopyrimidine deaminase/5-amino-6-(5-phosphoribosylamino)uracil reductase
LTTSTYTTANICNQLYKLNIQSLIIEGGAKTLQSFIDVNLWDEARVFKGISEFKNGIKGPQCNGTVVTKKNINQDLLTIYKND